jgi:heptosyltransferase III
LAVRLDSDGDVLLTGPALRALSCGSRSLDLLVSPSGEAAARLLPGVDDLLVTEAPWAGHPPPDVDRRALEGLLQELARRQYDVAVVFTSFHQSPLPMALVARLAGVPHIAALSEEYPGSLLDVRLRRVPGSDDDGGPAGGHEVEAALRLAAAAGFELPDDDDRRLRIKPVSCPGLTPSAPYVVVHPVASVPSRSIDLAQAAAITAALRHDGWEVVVTGTAAQREAGAVLASAGARDLVGRTSFRQLAAVLAGAECLVVGNTGPAHLAAAVGTPVVSLFSPVVPLERWAPWGVPSVVLGDQQAPCRRSRARECPVPGHPCTGGVSPAQVTEAVRQLTGTPLQQPATAATGGTR